MVDSMVLFVLLIVLTHRVYILGKYIVDHSEGVF